MVGTITLESTVSIPVPKEQGTAPGRQFLQLTEDSSAPEIPALPEETRGTVSAQTRAEALGDYVRLGKITCTRKTRSYPFLSTQ